MKPVTTAPNINEVLTCISTLPRKILSLHDHQAVTDLVLHELCSDNCFNFKRAAYIVDNPDFDCCRGVAGFSGEELSHDLDRAWENPDDFAQHINQASFNQKVRELSYASITKNNADYVTQELGRRLGMQQPSVRTWRIKNGNFGVLLFEPSGLITSEVPAQFDFLDDGLSVLGFCPLF